MSLFNRRALLILPLALAACGFSPVYAPGGNGDALDGRIEVSPPDSPNTYMLVRNLEGNLGRAANPEYRLNISLATRNQGQAITADNSILRYSIIGRVNYSLIQVATGEVVSSGDVSNFVGYSATGSTVETLASEKDANKRLMVILADQLTTELYTLPDLSA
ncbi:MAG: LPS assembly lipoprotein LptE [Paracoccaceae bacterium]